MYEGRALRDVISTIFTQGWHLVSWSADLCPLFFLEGERYDPLDAPLHEKIIVGELGL